MEPVAQPPPAGIRWNRLFPDFLMHLRRATRVDYTVGVATPEERVRLALPGTGTSSVQGSQAQDYLAWRRSGLWVAAAFLSVTAVVATIGFFADLVSADENPNFNAGMMNFLSFLLLFAKLVLPVAALFAVRRWFDLPTSHRRIRTGWWIGFTLPFLVALVPLTSLIHFPEAGSMEEVTQQKLLLMLTGLLMAIVWFMQLMPAVLSVVGGGLRASLAVKQFAPESAVPGWIAVVASPFAVLLGLVMFVIFNQVGGNALLLVAFALLVGGLLVFTVSARRIARPHTRAELASVLAPIRRRSLVLNGLGLVFLVIAAFTMELIPGQKLVAFSEGTLSPLKLLEMGLDFYGRALFTTVLFSDLIVALLRHSWHESAAFRMSELSGVLETKIREMEQAGVGALRKTAPPAASSNTAS